MPEQRSLPDGHALVTDEQLCPDMAACRAHVATLTAYDQRLHTRYSTRFDARVKAAAAASDEASDDSASASSSATTTTNATSLTARVAALAPVTVPTSEEVRKRTGATQEEWFGGAPPDAKCAWQHQPTAPEYAVTAPCGRVSTAVGRLVQGVVAGAKSVDARYAAEGACCLKFGEVQCNDGCQRQRAAREMLVSEGEEQARGPGEAMSMSDSQRKALARVALLAERRHSKHPAPATAPVARQSSMALLASSDRLEAADAQPPTPQMLLDLEETSGSSSDSEGLWRVVTPARAAELRAMHPSRLWSPRR